MFAGPNGSGKSTLQSVIRPELLGVYINPDEIEKDILRFDFLDLAQFGIRATEEEILEHFQASPLLAKADLLEEAEELRFTDDKLSFFAVGVNSYFASVAADFVRQKLLQAGMSFTFETVMSSPDKIDLLRTAQDRGYRTYLYYVATDDPVINLSRVRNRVRMGGHPVPDDKVVSRYARSLDLLFDAVRHAHRAYIFDNSGRSQVWLAEVTDGRDLRMKTENMPAWFKTALWDKFEEAP